MVVMLSVGTETCLAQERLCKHTEVAVALSFAVVLKLHRCCEAEVPWCLNTEGDCSSPLVLHVHLLPGKVSESYMSQMLCRSFPYLYPFIETPDPTSSHPALL